MSNLVLHRMLRLPPTLVLALQALDSGPVFRPLPSNTGSDHATFFWAGVPAVILSTPDASVIHTSQDTMEQVHV